MAEAGVHQLEYKNAHALQIRPSTARGKWTIYSYCTVMIKISKIFYISTLLTGTQHNNINLV